MVDMPLSRTRSLLANINSSSSSKPIIIKLSLIILVLMDHHQFLCLKLQLGSKKSNLWMFAGESYLPHISDTQHLPPLKSKLIGGPGTLFNGVGSTHALNQSDNCDSMSINGSIVSNGSGVTSTSGVTNGVATATMANGHVNGVHVNGMATLPLVRPATGGDTSRNSTLESPKHGDPNGTQNGES